MPAVSFRVKLLLAMMAVVAGVTGATVFLTQRSLEAAYRKLAEEQFRREIQAFSELQAARLEAVGPVCAQFEHSVRFRQLLRRLKDALASNDPEDFRVGAKELYQTAWFQPGLHEILAGSDAAAVGRAALFCFLNGQGRLIAPPPGIDAGLPNGERAAAFAAQLAALGRVAADDGDQKTGYLAVRSADKLARLLQLVVTRISDSADGSAAGSLVLGFPVHRGRAHSDQGRTRTAPSAHIQSGIWQQDALYSDDVAPLVRTLLAEQIRRAAAGARPPGDYLARIGGAPYRVFYETLPQGAGFPPAYQICLYSMADALDQQRRLREEILGFGGLALAGAFVMSFLLSHGLAAPIRELTAGTREIQAGNFGVKVPVRSRDEIGQLARSFNQMAEDLALKEKYRSVLNLVADKEVAQQLVSGAVALGGETRQVSVLFCDIRGFTSLTQKMDPAEVIQLLNEHMTALTRVVYEHRGVVDKFVGDLIMAVFGAPKQYANDCVQAVDCARQMILERLKLNQTSRYQIQIGIGIATGPAVAGCMGSLDRLNYTVLGPRVNLASRLCGQAGPMQVVIDETTRRQLADAIRVESMPELRLKGFSAPVRAFQLLEVQSLAQPHANSA